ncbi:hypothetical protein D3C76_1575360 [compost metagenome]
MYTKQLDSTRQYLRALELFSLYFVDRSELVEAGLLDNDTLMLTGKAHAFIDNTHDAERWKKVIEGGGSLDDAVRLADKFAREDLGLL